MSLETNKAVVRRLYDEVANGRNLDLLDEIVSEDPRTTTHFQDCRTRDPKPTKLCSGVPWRLPDFHMEIEDVIAEGDRVPFG